MAGEELTLEFLADKILKTNMLWQEWFYWVTVIVMFFIHIGFSMYEAGVARRKNVGHTFAKNVMLFALICFTFYLFGWWVYAAFAGTEPISAFIPNLWWDAGPFAPLAPPMAGHFQDRFHLAFLFAFLLFAQTEGSILSGAVIERIRVSSCIILAILVGSFVWIWLAAQAWSPWGWTLKWLGTHDAYASGIIHTIGGFFTLGVLINLGPRIGKFDPQGRPRDIPLHNQWLTSLGLFIIITGFWGFYFACNVPTMLAWDITMPYWGTVNIFGNPTTLSIIGTNFMMSMAGGFMGGYYMGRGNPFWIMSGMLMGVIGASAGNDLYHPFQAFTIGFITAILAYKLHYWVERTFKIDDAVGACAVHGYSGVLGLLYPGFILWGYPTGGPPFGFEEFLGYTSPWGQLGVALWEASWAFTFGFLASLGLKKLGVLRVDPLVELVGLDFSSPAFQEFYPYFAHQPLERLPEIDRVQLEELRKLLEQKGVKLNNPKGFASKDSGREDYLPPASPRELLEDAFRLHLKYMKEGSK